ncbi:uncharacterized protein LOC127263115 isoform X4 [Andrographis paniculata]|uniref:uncharacterized protein LOC127263115 isoform X4 n=1 Tax=Andrographis paniculata TaxID=175694 RepID=UPI0021E79E0F|nr:uncharacterized protein LOC127263115 isoform X4 [Andrographis paniculata]
MAQFTASGRLKCLFSGDGLSVGFEAFHQRKAEEFGSATGALRFAYLRSLPHGNHKRRLCFFSGVTVHASTPSSSPVRNYSDDIFDDASEDDHAEIDIDELAGFRGLVLDISYRPVNVVCWRRAICLEYMDKVPHLLQVVKRRKMKRGLSRKNIFHRDNFMCQYCSSQENLTVDHVLPIARGGKWTWENLVAACAKCNSKKGQKTLEEADMKLMKVPKAPKDFDILAIPLTNHAIKMLKARKGMPEEWRQYLSKPYVGP